VIRDSRCFGGFGDEIFGVSSHLGVLNISSKFRLKTPSGLGDPSIESLGLFRGLIFRGRYYRHCAGSTDDLIFSCQRVLIGSTDSRKYRPSAGSTDNLDFRCQ
jgi:hypothetical protein